MRDVDRPNDPESQDAVALLLRLAGASDPEPQTSKTVNGWRRDGSSGWSDAELERCRHGFTAGQFCDVCDREAS